MVAFVIRWLYLSVAFVIRWLYLSSGCLADVLVMCDVK